MGTIPEVGAKDADLTEPGVLYSAMLQQYVDGKKNVFFLKKLAMMAGQNGDATGRTRFGNEYLSSLKAPYSADEMSFIESNTKKVTDPGFKILLSHLATLKGAEQRTLQVNLMNVVFQDVIDPYVPKPDSKPDWNEVETKVRNLGSPGEEMFLRAKTIHTYNQQDWKGFMSAAGIYLSKYGTGLKENEKAMFQKALDEHKDK